MKLARHYGWGTLLFACSRACNLGCDGCWTSATNETIRTQLKMGAEWLYDGSYGINVLEAMLAKFREKGGKLVACMSDGEPLVPGNFGFIFKLAKGCGKTGLPLLLFTNGIYLDKEKLLALEKATAGRISYCVSMQTGTRERYGEFMLTSMGGNGAGEKLFGGLKEKFGVWKEFNERTLARTEKHGLSIHTYIIPGKTNEEDMEALKGIVRELGNVPWIVSTMAAHVSESLAGGSICVSPQTTERVEKYNTGPTATLSLGEGENNKLCAYIAHGFFPLKEQKGVYGITFNPYYKGQVQTCPYHSMLGTMKWLNLRDYLDAVKKSGKDITCACVGKWLEAAIQAETRITRATFELKGYEHCLMRHSRKPEIDLFISGVNVEMGKRRKEGKLEPSSEGYFEALMKNLGEAIEAAAAQGQKKQPALVREG